MGKDMKMRITIGLTALAALAACGGDKATGNAAANAVAPANSAAAPAAGPANSSAAANLAAGGSAISPRPVMVGVDAELDKCPSTGRVNGTRAVTVRAAPNPAAGDTDRINRVVNVAICDQDRRNDPQAGWYAIVYPPPGDELGGCGLDGASAGNGGVAYAGPCKSGWVRSTDIEVIAG